MTPKQSRQARRLLGCSQLRLAIAADVKMLSVTAFELGMPTSADAILAIRTALEAAGIEFIAENGGGVGVRLRENKGGLE